MLKIKFERLAYQEKAVNSISNVFQNVSFAPNENHKYINVEYRTKLNSPELFQMISDVLKDKNR